MKKSTGAKKAAARKVAIQKPRMTGKSRLAEGPRSPLAGPQAIFDWADRRNAKAVAVMEAEVARQERERTALISTLEDRLGELNARMSSMERRAEAAGIMEVTGAPVPVHTYPIPKEVLTAGPGPLRAELCSNEPSKLEFTGWTTYKDFATGFAKMPEPPGQGLNPLPSGSGPIPLERQSLRVHVDDQFENLRQGLNTRFDGLQKQLSAEMWEKLNLTLEALAKLERQIWELQKELGVDTGRAVNAAQ